MRKKVYISFPMKGRTVKDYTEQERCAYKRLESDGFKPISPIRDNSYPQTAPVHLLMNEDYKLVLSCDAIFLCEGWEYSHGCMNELQVAADCRLKVLTSDMTDSRIKQIMGV